MSTRAALRLQLSAGRQLSACVDDRRLNGIGRSAHRRGAVCLPGLLQAIQGGVERGVYDRVCLRALGHLPLRRRADTKHDRDRHYDKEGIHPHIYS
jgi:hypothetical protein